MVCVALPARDHRGGLLQRLWVGGEETENVGSVSTQPFELITACRRHHGATRWLVDVTMILGARQCVGGAELSPMVVNYVLKPYPVGRPKMGGKLDLSASKCFNDMGPQGCRPREGGYRGAQNEEGERGGTRFSRSSRLGRQGPPSASPPLMAVILGYNAKFRVTDAEEGRGGRGRYPTSIAVPNGGVLAGPRTVVLSLRACVRARRALPCRSRSGS